MAVFCPNCGTQNADGDKFCQNCGTKLETAPQPEVITYGADTSADSTQPSYGAPVQENTQSGFGGTGSAAEKKKVNPIPLIIAAAAIIVVIVAIVLIKSIFSYQKIDAKDLFDVSFAGPDGYGVCYAQLDVDPSFARSEYDVDMEDYSLTKAASADESKKSKKKEIEYSKYFSDERKDLEEAYPKASNKSAAKEMRDALLKVNKGTGEFKLKCKPSKSGGLKNGDKITVEVDFDEEYLKENKIKLENTSWEVEVKGLQKAISIDDAFLGFEPKFEGLDGEGQCDYDAYGGEYKFMYYYNDSSSYSLTNGDKLKFVANCEVYDTTPLDEKDETKGFWFKYEDKFYVWPYAEKTAEKEYTVAGLKGLEEVDPANEVELEFTGASPFVDVSAKVKEGSEFKDNISVSVDDDYNDRYKAGDKVKVKVYGYYGLKDAGYKLKGADDDGYAYIDVTIPDTVPHYATLEESAAADAAMNDKFTEAETTIKQKIQGNSYLGDGVSLESDCKSVTDMKVVSTYHSMNNITEYENLGWGAAVNKISRIYKLDLKLKKGEQTVYIVVEIADIINTDGTYATENDVEYTFYEKNRDAVEAVEGLEGFTVAAVGSEPAATESKPDESSVAESAADVSSSSADTSSAADTSTSSVAESRTEESAAESKADSSSEMVP